jgi:hypothetical protein
LTTIVDRNIIVEVFNNDAAMATVNFSVPEDVKDDFNAAFEGRNKSAIVAELMREAVEREQRQREHVEAMTRILKRRKIMVPLPKGSIARVLRELRK